MTRSNFAISRLIVLPYSGLLALYLLVIGGGAAGLYFQVRAVETRLLVKEVRAAIAPVAEKLGTVDAMAAMREAEPWLVADIKRLRTDNPSLRSISLRGPESGYLMDIDPTEVFSSKVAAPWPDGAKQARTTMPAEQRLHGESNELFVIRYDLSDKVTPSLRLDLAFDRSALLTRLDGGLATIERSVLIFGVAGAVGILLALGVTVVAMRTTRRLEGHFQEIYRRASITEMAAQLVHDLRNPLAALRANVKALLVTPQHTPEIVEELDRDILSLNDKLSAFLNLTRWRDDVFEALDVGELITDAVRLAEPELAKHGLHVDVDISPQLPRPKLQRASMRDALLNVIINASQSGQQQGAIRVAAKMHDGVLQIVVDDKGKGIPLKDLPHLFDAFFTTREKGNGLGLAIAQRIASLHQGRVHAENRPDGGARVVISVPLQRKEDPHWWIKLRNDSPV